MKGTRKKDLMNGKAGGDTLYGNKAVDFLSGGEGSDKLYSGPGGGYPDRERGLGGPGSDSLYGSGGRDQVSDGTGSDKVYGGTEIDSVSGGPAFCTAPLDYSSDCPIPSEFDSSDDYIYGGPGHDTLSPGWVSGGVDHLYGEDGTDHINANQEADIFPGPVTKEIVDCGPGDDWVVYDQGVDVVMNNCEHLNDNYGNPGT
jgi:Ca2+-binding RTX toxin-like protein